MIVVGECVNLILVRTRFASLRQCCEALNYGLAVLFVLNCFFCCFHTCI